MAQAHGQHKTHRINEARDRFEPPPRETSNLHLDADGQLVRREADGTEFVLADAETLEPLTFDTIPTEAAPDAPPRAPKRAPTRTDPEPTTDPEGDGRGFARAHMSPQQLAKAEARDERRAAPAPSTAKSESVRDGQDMARSDMSAEQIARLERRDRARGHG